MRKLKYNEKTKIISFRVPVTKIPEVREKVNQILFGIKEELQRPEFPEDRKDLSVKNLIKSQAAFKKKMYELKCDCYLDASGFLRRGKIKCAKSKKEHYF